MLSLHSICSRQNILVGGDLVIAVPLSAVYCSTPIYTWFIVRMARASISATRHNSSEFIRESVIWNRLYLKISVPIGLFYILYANVKGIVCSEYICNCSVLVCMWMSSLRIFWNEFTFYISNCKDCSKQNNKLNLFCSPFTLNPAESL